MFRSQRLSPDAGACEADFATVTIWQKVSRVRQSDTTDHTVILEIGGKRSGKEQFEQFERFH